MLPAVRSWMYSLPVKARTWPLLDDPLQLVDRVVPLGLGEVVGVGTDDAEHEPHRVAHLREQRDPALEVLPGEQLLEAAHLAGLGRVVGDAGQAALPRSVVGEVLVPLPVAQRLDEVVVEVRHLRGIQRLDPAEADHPGGHPVGEHHHVAVDRLARAELVADLGEELRVVVDVVGVVDGDPGLVLEDLQRRGLLAGRVDVGRPVRDHQSRLARGEVGRHARCRVLLRAVDPEPRQHGGTADRERGSPAPCNTPRRVAPLPALIGSFPVASKPSDRVTRTPG